MPEGIFVADKYAHFKTDWYIDQNSREWMCIRRNEGMCCTCTDGSFTAATFATFSSWGWKRKVLDSSSAVERLAVNEDVAGSKPACPATLLCAQCSEPVAGPHHPECMYYDILNDEAVAAELAHMIEARAQGDARKTDWELLAAQRGIDLAILEEALIEIDEYRPSRESGEPYMDIAGFVMKRARLALKELRQSRAPASPQLSSNK